MNGMFLLYTDGPGGMFFMEARPGEVPGEFGHPNEYLIEVSM